MSRLEVLLRGLALLSAVQLTRVLTAAHQLVPAAPGCGAVLPGLLLFGFDAPRQSSGGLQQ